MTARTRKINGGFTLVEILIVVVILGILAAIVIPQFTNASESAKASSMASTLQTLRSQLELAQVQHQGTYPDLVEDSRGWQLLTTETEPDTAYTAGDDSGNEVGPYMQQAPVNPFTPDNGTNGTTSIGDEESTTTAWSYDSSSGEIKAVVNLTSAQAKALGLIDDDTATTHSDVVIVGDE